MTKGTFLTQQFMVNSHDPIAKSHGSLMIKSHDQLLNHIAVLVVVNSHDSTIHIPLILINIQKRNHGLAKRM